MDDKNTVNANETESLETQAADETPVTVDEAPEATDEAPEATDEAPEITDVAPEVTGEAPEADDELPEDEAQNEALAAFEADMAAQEEMDQPVTVVDFEGEAEVLEDSEKGSNIHGRLANSGITERPKYERGKLTFKQRVETFFYLYKGRVLVCIGIAALLAFLIIGSLPAKLDYYVAIYSKGESIRHADTEKLDELIAACGRDVDGNGEVVVSMPSYSYFAQDYYMSAVAMLYFDQDISSEHRCYLIIMDREHYDEITESYTEEVFEEHNGLPRFIPLKDSNLLLECSYREGDRETDDLGLVLVSKPLPQNLKGSAKKQREALERYDQAVELFESILEAYPELVENLED